MDVRGLPSSSQSSSSQAPYQRVPSLSSAPIMDHTRHTSTDNQSPPAGEPVNDGKTTGYVYPSVHDQFNNPSAGPYANSSSNTYIPPQNPFRYPDHHQQQQDDDSNNQLSSSSPLRLDNDPNHYADDDDSESITPAYLSTITPPGKILLLQTLTTLSTIVFT
ncbi:hypothetical protein BGZ96_005103, partial [Linnemannia gamsii]